MARERVTGPMPRAARREVARLAESMYRERLAPLVEEDTMGRSLNMPRSIRPSAERTRGDQKIYAWPVVGSTRGAGGAAAKYTVLLWSHGGVTCDCPGWIFYHKKNGGCKHTKNVTDTGEAQAIFTSWQRGETLPGQEQEADAATEVSTQGTTTGRMSSRTPSRSNAPKQMTDDHSRLKYGRFIEID